MALLQVCDYYWRCLVCLRILVIWNCLNTKYQWELHIMVTCHVFWILPLREKNAIVDFFFQLQKLKRSLSSKTKSLRSKSADNFFQQTNCGTKLQVDLLSEITSRSGQLPNLESQNSTPTNTHLQPEDKIHIFQEHIFKKPTFCDVCNHMIVGKKDFTFYTFCFHYKVTFLGKGVIKSI